MPRMRLIDDLAARRLYYPRPLPTLPDILVIDVPTRFAGAGLALDHYYPIVLETLAEMQEMEAFLCTDRGGPVVPDLFDRRPSGLRVRDIVFARYPPAAPDWPFLLLCSWPESYTAMVPRGGDDFARGAYTIEAFENESALEDAEQTLLATLGVHQARRVRSVGATIGNA